MKRNLSPLVLLTLLLMAPALVPADVLLHVQPAAAATSPRPERARPGAVAPAAATRVAEAPATLVLKEPTLITKISAAQSAAGVLADICLRRDGAVVHTEPCRRDTGDQVVINPYLVFPAGTYTIEVNPPGQWRRDAKGVGAVLVEGRPASRLAAATAIQSHLAAAGPAVAPFRLSEALANARVDASRLKSDLAGQTQGFQTNVTSGSAKAAERMGLQPSTGGPPASTVGNAPGSGRAKAMDAMGSQGPITGRNADTFAGQSINNRASGGGAGNFAGDGRSHAASGSEDDGLYDTIVSMLNDAGGTVTGDPQTDAAEAAYMMSVGSDGWEATKDMSQSEREAYWRNEYNRQMLGVGRPREDDNPSGSGTGFIIFGNKAMRENMFRFQARAIEARRGRAGSAQASNAGGGPVRLPGGNDDRPVPERQTGTINWDAVLQINELVNPTRQ